MVANKHLTKITIVLIVLAVLTCFLALIFPAALKKLAGGSGVLMEYETKLFDKSQVIDLDIEMSAEKWDEMLQNALTEEYYTCDVTVNGEKIKNVAIRPKGNTSLSSIAMDPDTDRFSLKLEFDHFVEAHPSTFCNKTPSLYTQR